MKKYKPRWDNICMVLLSILLIIALINITKYNQTHELDVDSLCLNEGLLCEYAYGGRK